MTGAFIAQIWWVIGTLILGGTIWFADSYSKWDVVKSQPVIGRITWNTIYVAFQTIIVLSIVIPLKWFFAISYPY